MALLPWLIHVSSSNPLTREVLHTGWSPVLAAMAISRYNIIISFKIYELKCNHSNSLGGVILDFTVSAYKGIAVFQPVINGVGGNLVAVQASRLSTWLHKRGRPGEPVFKKKNHNNEFEHYFCVSPASTFCNNGVHAKTARVLLLLVSYSSTFLLKYLIKLDHFQLFHHSNRFFRAT